MEACLYHQDHEGRIKRAEEDIQRIDIKISKHGEQISQQNVATAKTVGAISGAVAVVTMLGNLAIALFAK